MVMTNGESGSRVDAEDETQKGNRERVERALRLLKLGGGRRTPVRQAVLSLLAESPSHLTTRQIYERINATGLFSDPSVVNRTVNTFLNLGVIHVLPAPGDAAYGLVDPPHHHAICTQCGAVAPLPADTFRAVVRAAEDVSGFQLDDAGLGLAGTCPACQQS